MLTLNDGRTELWQWDTGRKLTVDAECSQVHFSNKVFGRSIDVDVVDGVAIIPDILLQTDKDLTAWAFVGTSENGYTKISEVFKVNRRNKPADYVFTPTDQASLEELIERLDAIEESQDPDAIKNAVDEYLADNPIQIEEEDPNVPDWAKQPAKPKYTAKEVGAVATVNGITPDEKGNVQIEVGSGGDVDLTGYATEQYVQGYAQPKGDYLTEVPEGYAKTEDIPTKPEDIGAQPAGNYLTEVPTGYATEEFVKNKIAEAELSGEEVDLSGYAQKSELPTKVSQLENDKGYLTQHQDISGKLDASALPTAINTALAQAKASGEFKGDKGDKGDKGEQGIQGEKGDTGATGSDANVTAQNIAKALGYTPANETEVDSLSSNQSALSARMDTFTKLGEGSTTGDAELIDARVDCEGKVWDNAGGHIRGITEKIIDACCDKEIVGVHNYNLFKISEVSFSSRLDNTSTEIVSSGTNNFVTGWFPVTYGKYYAPSIYRSDLGRRSRSGIVLGRVQLKLADGTIKIYTNDSSNSYPFVMVGDYGVAPVDDENAVYMRLQLSMYVNKVNQDVSTADKMKVWETMIVEGDTAEEANNNSLNLEYLDGDIEMESEVKYTLKKQTAQNEFDPTGYYLPILYLTGDVSPIAESKDNEVTLDYVYKNKTGTCTLKGQGASSYTAAKKLIEAGKAGKFNYTIKFDNKFEAVSGWGSQKKYCLKANFIDHTHSRNVVSCKLWGKIVKSRTTVPTELENLPNGGAVDGFPVIIMLNGEFHGLYTFNIPKDGWMFGLVEDATKTQALVGADSHTPATQFKGELAGDESDFELEFVSDKSSTDWVTTSLNRLINACINSDGTDLDTTLAQYIDWDSAIDYYIHAVVEKGSDTVDKNFLLVTFNGTKWYFTNYDRDSTYGLAWDASGLTIADANVIDFEACANTSRIFELIRRYKTAELKSRYAKLRSNILSESRICREFETFVWDISTPILLEDVKKYPTIRGSSANTIDQICRWIHQRLEACDKWVEAL